MDSDQFQNKATVNFAKPSLNDSLKKIVAAQTQLASRKKALLESTVHQSLSTSDLELQRAGTHMIDTGKELTALSREKDHPPGDEPMKDRKTPRKPATKFPNLRKKLAKNKTVANQTKTKRYEPK